MCIYIYVYIYIPSPGQNQITFRYSIKRVKINKITSTKKKRNTLAFLDL